MGHSVGIVGFGGMGGWHYENIKRIDGLTVSAVCDIDPERVEKAKEFGLTGYTDLHEFLKDDSFDIVVVATPNNFHKPIAIAALESGKNVVCEKPMAMSCEEITAMAEAAEKAGKLVTVHKNRRWDRDFQMVKNVFENGTIGKPYSVESRVHGKNGRFVGWRDKKENGGGALYDWAPHMVDQVLALDSTKVTEVYAQMHKVLSNEVEDYFKLMLRFESGFSAQVEVGTFCLVSGPRWIAHGDKGSMIIEDFACNGEIVLDGGYAINWDPTIKNNTAAGPTRTMAPRPPETLKIEELPNVDDKTDWCQFYKNLMSAIDGEAELLVKPEAALRVMKIIESAFKSNELGEVVKVNV